MKKTIIVMSVLLAGSAMAADTYVSPHIRKDGTYVPGHYRTAPDRNTNNNYSAQGNTNPYTGQEGTVNPYAQQQQQQPTYLSNPQPQPTYQQPYQPLYKPYGTK